MPEIVLEQSWREKLQDLAARRKDSWPLVALAVVALAVALVSAGRTAPAQVAPPAAPAPPPSAVVPTSGPRLLVHVAGAVRDPGLYEFLPGARVADAVQIAGGPLRRADLHALNLAEPLLDGTRIEVVEVGDTPPPATPSSIGQDAGPIPLNSADQILLETIPGVGPVTATAILSYRDEIGGFTSLDQLLEVDGIGPATFDSIRDYVTL